jgi:hydrogenase maturation protein HypF
MGRLFDTVSSILGICQKNDYEGQAAIMLENEAFKALELKIPYEKMNFDIIKDNGRYAISSYSVILSLLRAKEEGKSTAPLALGFHEALSRTVLSVSELIRKDTGVKSVALSGGVFQNRILLSRCFELLKSSGFSVYTNRQSPPNDGGIALGQAYIASCVLKQK